MALLLNIVALCILIATWMNDNWRMLRRSRLLQHLLFGSAAIISFIWLFSAKLEQGLSIHFLLITTITLMLGFRYALLAGVAIVAVNSLHSNYPIASVGALYLSHIVIPAAVTYVAYAVIYHRLPRHPFIYIFLNAFIAAAVAIAATHLAHAAWALTTAMLTPKQVWENYLMITPLVMFPEALLNGMAVTLMVVYRPNWLVTFNDKQYIDPN
ncbi:MULTISPECIES: energy-coupling factor ABC transporter permease [unclassified Idiomarina]|jgi:uncharacterized membrane protein|uniref:energy-coupling factor ABC transporter permease n=1 Tax=unclassified Idiomarina TaxID=2614829 RepID=UPI000C90C2A4|nr:MULTISPECIES: energy-coupling factor ABC transporter permease [unclassified Idiomarina]MAD54968.1 hypothetical protein [Idiomarinaceae bacterium]MEC7642332.1 energy-coupling factor ABC transporter permease [Pseudomonadota bacterium]NQZ04411.1 energy-coupling factor ABC transporter permease [Idiomarina sp.]|tara:strand:+ start:1240 stop:1875 length:636 start_codon:yes stop_codon:yes gene_type:complete